VWHVTEEDLEDIAVGAGILGTGGGGNPHRGRLLARKHLRAGDTLRVVSLDEVPADALAVSVGGIGAPVIGLERLSRGDEGLVALRALEGRLGRAVTHIVPGEIGGGNSTLPMVVGALAGLPVVDADGMGRAFPEMQMTTFYFGGAPASPAALADYRHSTVVFDNLADARTLERLARAVTVAMGGAAVIANAIMTGAELPWLVVPGTLSFARRLGAAVRAARRAHADPVAAACTASGGGQLFHGKVTDVQRRLVAGFARGELLLEGLGDCRGRTLRIAFQNENLIAWEVPMRRGPRPGVAGAAAPDRPAAGSAQMGNRTGSPIPAEGEEVIAVTPDLICLVDELTAEPVTTEVVRYGLRVAVLGIPAPPQLRTEAALAVVGPGAFGYDVPYRPLPGVYGGAPVRMRA
jgi:DUF917 family protein